jgi:hypothetical protein
MPSSSATGPLTTGTPATGNPVTGTPIALDTRRLAALAVGLLALLSLPVDAGDPLGWSTAAQQVADSGVSAGSVLTVLGIVATGAVVWFGLTQLLVVTLPMTFGGIIMSQADAIAGVLFAGGGGGALVTGYLPPPGL